MKTASQSETVRILHLLGGAGGGLDAQLSARVIADMSRASARAMVHEVHLRDGADEVRAAQARFESAGARTLPDFPASPSGLGLPGLHRIARAMQGFDLLCTYGWGAIDAVMAHTAFAQPLALAPLIHHENGFCEPPPRDFSGEDPELAAQREAERERGWRRRWYRRIALGGVQALIVPSQAASEFALRDWQQPPGRVHLIRPGIALGKVGRKPRRDGLAGIRKHKGEAWIGVRAGQLAKGRFSDLLSALSRLPDNWQLVILDGRQRRDEWRAQAIGHELSHRLHLPDCLPGTDEMLTLFDLFLELGEGPRFPLTMVEAMAAGVPVLAARGSVGEELLGEEASRWCFDPSGSAQGSDEGLGARLAWAVQQEAARRAAAIAVRKRAEQNHGENRMLRAYRETYAAMLGPGGSSALSRGLSPAAQGGKAGG